MQILFALFLASLPITNWLLEYYFSKNINQLKLFRKHFTAFYADLVLIPLNFFIAYIIQVNIFYIFILFLFSLSLTFILYPYWSKIHNQEKNPSFMFNNKTKKISSAGISHFIFEVLETVILLLFLLVNTFNFISYINFALLFLFLILCLIGSKKIHKKVILTDLIFAIFGMALIIVRLISSFQ